MSDPADPSLAARYRALAEQLSAGAASCATCGESTLRVGTDVQEIDAVAAALTEHAERYLRRVYTEREVADSRGGAATWTGAAIASLTARYAVKESVVKVLRPVQTGIDWRSVETVRERGGWSTLVLHGGAQLLAREAGLGAWSISFGHDGPVAVATVLVRHECRAANGRLARSHGP